MKTQVSSLQSWMNLKADENKIFEGIKCCPFMTSYILKKLLFFSFKRCNNIVCNRSLLNNEAYKRVGCPISLSEIISKFSPFGGFLGLVIYLEIFQRARMKSICFVIMEVHSKLKSENNTNHLLASRSFKVHKKEEYSHVKT